MCVLMTCDTEDDIRALFTEIGCIMEDASLIALVWAQVEELGVRAKFDQLSAANERISELLKKIKIEAGIQ